MTPQIAVILKSNEVPFYTSVLPRISYELFPSEDHFIDHIT